MDALHQMVKRGEVGVFGIQACSGLGTVALPLVSGHQLSPSCSGKRLASPEVTSLTQFSTLHYFTKKSFSVLCI